MAGTTGLEPATSDVTGRTSPRSMACMSLFPSGLQRTSRGCFQGATVGALVRLSDSILAVHSALRVIDQWLGMPDGQAMKGGSETPSTSSSGSAPGFWAKSRSTQKRDRQRIGEGQIARPTSETRPLVPDVRQYHRLHSSGAGRAAQIPGGLPASR